VAEIDNPGDKETDDPGGANTEVGEGQGELDLLKPDGTRGILLVTDPLEFA